MGVVLSQGTLFGQSQVNHVSQAGIHFGQSKGALSCGEPLYIDGGLKVSEASLPQMGSSHEGRDSPGNQGHSSLLAGQGYGRSHSGSGVATDGNLGAGGVLIYDPRGRGEFRTVGRPCHGGCTEGSRGSSPRRSASGAGNLAICNDTRVGRKLIESPPSTVDEAVHRVKTYQLSHQVFDPCRREVRMVSVGRQSQGLGCTSGGTVIPPNREYLPL
uniref:Uncharacterized protein n=1 Tax=Magallana gigas TaxID=29159 RepID=K1R062_MAGGI